MLLAAGQAVRCVLFILIDAHIHQRAVYPLAHFARRDPDVFQPEGNILLDHRCYDLVVRVLEYHSDLLTDIVQPFLVGSIHPVHIDLASRRQQNGVEMLGKGAFARAVMSKHSGQLALADGHIQVLKDVDCLLALLHMIAETDPLCFDKVVHQRCYHLFLDLEMQTPPDRVSLSIICV